MSRNRATAYYNYFKIHGLDKIHYPVEPNQVHPLEDKLPTNISLFSFYDDELNARFPLYVSEKEYNRSVDLLYWQGHFALIKDFASILYNITRMRVKIWFCRKCFVHFMREDALDRHHLFCNLPTSRTPSTSCLPRGQPTSSGTCESNRGCRS